MSRGDGVDVVPIEVWCHVLATVCAPSTPYAQWTRLLSVCAAFRRAIYECADATSMLRDVIAGKGGALPPRLVASARAEQRRRRFARLRMGGVPGETRQGCALLLLSRFRTYDRGAVLVAACDGEQDEVVATLLRDPRTDPSYEHNLPLRSALRCPAIVKLLLETQRVDPIDTVLETETEGDPHTASALGEFMQRRFYVDPETARGLLLPYVLAQPSERSVRRARLLRRCFEDIGSVGVHLTLLQRMQGALAPGERVRFDADVMGRVHFYDFECVQTMKRLVAAPNTGWALLGDADFLVDLVRRKAWLPLVVLLKTPDPARTPELIDLVRIECDAAFENDATLAAHEQLMARETRDFVREAVECAAGDAGS